MIINKKENLKLSDHLTHQEFRCRCENPRCHYTLVDSHLIYLFEKLRNLYDKPIHITSGFRCQSHNTTVGGVINSMHTVGKAMDIVKADSFLIELSKEIFPTVIEYKTFLHCDVR